MAKKLLPIAIIAVSLLVALGLLKSRAPAEQSDPVQAAVLVEVVPVVQQDARITVASQGTVEPRTRTSLVSEVAGRVVEVSPDFVAGGFVREGDLLLRLEDQDYRAAVSRAEAALAAARSALEQERGQAAVAQREWDRMTPERQAQVQAQDLYLRKPQLEQAVASLESAEADLDQARADLAKTRLAAPYDALVSAKNTDLGQFVSTGAAIGEIFAVDYAEVRLPIPESKLTFLELPSAFNRDDAAPQGPQVELVSRLGDREQRWNGRLVRTEGVLDTRTRVLFSVVQVEDPYGIYREGWHEPLRVGTYVNAGIQGRRLEDVVVLPRHTLQSGNLVWVADPENRLRARRVEVVTVNGDQAYVASGFQPGDRVVITRLENPLNGMAVQAEALSAGSAVIQ